MEVRAQTMVLHQAKHPQICQLASSLLPREYILALAGSQQLGPSAQGASWLLLSPYHQDNAHARSEGLLGEFHLFHQRVHLACAYLTFHVQWPRCR